MKNSLRNFVAWATLIAWISGNALANDNIICPQDPNTTWIIAGCTLRINNRTISILSDKNERWLCQKWKILDSKTGKMVDGISFSWTVQAKKDSDPLPYISQNMGWWKIWWSCQDLATAILENNKNLWN